MNKLKQLLRRSWIPFLRLISPQRWKGELAKKNNFLCCSRFYSLWVALMNTKTCRGRILTGQIDREARLLWESTVKTKHRGLTSLDFMRLVPGANRVVRHICIRCIALLLSFQRYAWFCVLSLILHILWHHEYLICILEETWISLGGKQISQKEKRHPFSFWKVLKIKLYFNCLIFQFICTLSFCFIFIVRTRTCIPG